MIPLDIFKEISHNRIDKLEAWLYFIGSDSPKDICRVIEAFPEFKELYNELLMLRYKPKELIEMFDVIKEALRAADEGTVKYMIEEQLKEIDEQRKEINEQRKEIEEQRKEIDEQCKEIEGNKKTIAERDEQIEKQSKEIEKLKAMLGQANMQVD